MKYFVTGGTGFIGGRIIRQLRDAGHDVVALVRSAGRGADLERLGVRLHIGDVVNKESMHGAMHGVDGIFHTAGWYKLDDKEPSEAMRVNVEGTRNVLELMRAANVPKGVYTSTVAVYSDTRGKLVDESYYFAGPHLSVYDRSKWLAHHEVALPMIRAGLPLTIVLPGVVYGPEDTSPVNEMFARYLKGKLAIVPRKTAYCWSHVDDVARGHILAMEAGWTGESYILAGDAHTVIEALQIAERITGIPAPRRSISPQLLRMLAATMRVVGAVIPVPRSYRYEHLRVIAGVTYLADNARSRRELGYKPRSLEDGLRDTLPGMQTAETAPASPPTA